MAEDRRQRPPAIAAPTRRALLLFEDDAALAPIGGGRRFLDCVLDQVARQGFWTIDVVCGRWSNRLAERYGASAPHGAQVRVLGELGAGEPDAPLLALRADAYLDANLRAFERGAAALARPGVRAVLAGGGGEAGLYWLSAEAARELAGASASVATEALARLFAAEDRLAAITVSGAFLDLRRPGGVEQARRLAPAIERRPTAFLDRDGTLNIDAGYTHRPEDLVWTQGAPAAIRALNDRGYRVVVCTNQSGIGRGHFDEAAMHRFHRAMQDALAQAGAFIDAFYFSPYHTEAVHERYRLDHQDRKPNPGMLLRAMRDRPTDAARSFMIGDQETDLQAASAAGVPGYLYRSGSLADVVARALEEAAAGAVSGPHG